MTGRKKRKYNIYEAKTQLSKLIEQACNGDEVVVMTRGRPRVVLTPLEFAPRVRKFGTLKGKMVLLPGWDKPIDDFKDYE